MLKTFEDIVNAYGSRLDSYADDESIKIETYLERNGIEIYSADIDADKLDKCCITITNAKSFLRYLETHSIKEVFKFTEILAKQEFLLHFEDRVRETTWDQGGTDEENACALYCAYLDNVIGDNLCSRVIYCVAVCPMIVFSCDSDIGKILAVEDEIIEELDPAGNNIDEIIGHIEAAEKELDEAMEFLINDSDFRKCTNVELRNDYKSRKVLFENKRFLDLQWVLENYWYIRKIQEEEITKKAANICSGYNLVYVRAWKEIKNSRRI